jgi:hypothetical protein
VARDPVAELGLLGATPETALAAAGDAIEAGDLAAADASIRAVDEMLAAAPAVGQVRVVAVGGGGAAALLVLGLYAAVRLRRPGYASFTVPSDPSTPYATPPADVAATGVVTPGIEETIDPVTPVRPDPRGPAI